MGTSYNHRIWLVLAVTLNLPLYKDIFVNHLINHKQIIPVLGFLVNVQWSCYFVFSDESIIMKHSLIILALTLPFLLILVVLN
jgi:hypothetical protein